MVYGGEYKACEIRGIKFSEYFADLSPGHAKKELPVEGHKVLKECGQRDSDYVASNPESQTILQVFLNKEGLDGEGCEEQHDSLTDFVSKLQSMMTAPIAFMLTVSTMLPRVMGYCPKALTIFKTADFNSCCDCGLIFFRRLIRKSIGHVHIWILVVVIHRHFSLFID